MSDYSELKQLAENCPLKEFSHGLKDGVKPYIVAVTAQPKGNWNAPQSQFVVIGGTPTGGGPFWPAGICIDQAALAAFIAAADPTTVIGLIEKYEQARRLIHGLAEQLDNITSDDDVQEALDNIPDYHSVVSDALIEQADCFLSGREYDMDHFGPRQVINPEHKEA